MTCLVLKSNIQLCNINASISTMSASKNKATSLEIFRLAVARK